MADAAALTAPEVAGNGAGRVIRRRTALPGARAVVGALLVTVAAVGVFAAYGAARTAPDGAYVVAARDVAAGERIDAGDLAVVAIDLPAAQRRRAFDDPAALVGATALVALHRDDLVLAGAVARGTTTPAGREISLSLDAGRALDGRLRPGEQVDVVATYAGAGDAFSAVVARRALVVTVRSADGAIGAGGAVVLTLAVQPDEVLAVAHAAQAGDVTLVRTTGAQPAGAAPAGAESAGADPDVYRPAVAG